jgi:hypothetical protein
MPVRNFETVSILQSSNTTSPKIQSSRETTCRPKFGSSLEKKIERTWSESRKLGWDYNHFVTAMIEVLIILQQREKLRSVRAEADYK